MTAVAENLAAYVSIRGMQGALGRQVKIMFQRGVKRWQNRRREDMGEFVTVAKTSEVGPGQAKAVQVKGKTVALFNIIGTYYAIEDTCTHSGGPLSEGEVEGTTVTCPWHGAQFNVTSGEVLAAPAPDGVRSYKVQVQGDDITLEIS